MEDLNAKYKKRFDEIYHDSDMLSYVGYNKESKKIEFMCKKTWFTVKIGLSSIQ